MQEWLNPQHCRCDGLNAAHAICEGYGVQGAKRPHICIDSISIRTARESVSFDISVSASLKGLAELPMDGLKPVLVELFGWNRGKISSKEVRLSTSLKASGEFNLPDAEQWSAEKPVLYSLLFCFAGEVIPVNFGFGPYFNLFDSQDTLNGIELPPFFVAPISFLSTTLIERGIDISDATFREVFDFLCFVKSSGYNSISALDFGFFFHMKEEEFIRTEAFLKIKRIADYVGLYFLPTSLSKSGVAMKNNLSTFALTLDSDRTQSELNTDGGHVYFTITNTMASTNLSDYNLYYIVRGQSVTYGDGTLEIPSCAPRESISFNPAMWLPKMAYEEIFLEVSAHLKNKTTFGDFGDAVQRVQAFLPIELSEPEVNPTSKMPHLTSSMIGALEHPLDFTNISQETIAKVAGGDSFCAMAGKYKMKYDLLGVNGDANEVNIFSAIYGNGETAVTIAPQSNGGLELVLPIDSKLHQFKYFGTNSTGFVDIFEATGDVISSHDVRFLTITDSRGQGIMFKAIDNFNFRAIRINGAYTLTIYALSGKPLNFTMQDISLEENDVIREARTLPQISI